MTVGVITADHLLVDMWSLYPIICASVHYTTSLTSGIHLKYVSCEVQLDNLEASQLMFYFMFVISLLGE